MAHDRKPLLPPIHCQGLARCDLFIWSLYVRRALGLCAYLLSVVDRSLVAYQGPRCQACAGLRWSSQGRYQGFIERGFRAAMSGGQALRLPYPRHPWDPRAAVSDPRVLMAEFPDQVLEST